MKIKHKNMMVDCLNMLYSLDKKHKWNYNYWAARATEKESVDCGTSCCAVGWSIQMLASWQEEGIHLSTQDDGPTYFPLYKGRMLYNESEEALGISRDEFNYAFMGSTLPDIDDTAMSCLPGLPGSLTIIQVAKRVTKVLERHGYEVYEV